MQAVYRETEGNPFFVNEIVRLLVADGRLEKAEGVEGLERDDPAERARGRRPAPRPPLRGVQQGADDRRGHRPRVRLQAAGEGRGGEGRPAAGSARRGDGRARDRRAADARPDQYWFSHALIRETLYEELSTTRRIRLHRQIGEALEELDAEGNLPQLAYHFSEAAPGGDVEKAVDYAIRAAERAIALVAYEEAVTHYERRCR